MIKDVIVMGRNYTSILGMTRAVGEIGCQVTIIKTVKKVPGRFSIKRLTPETASKYVKKVLYVKEPDRAALFEILKVENKDKKERIIIPVDDYTASTVDMYKQQLSQMGYKFPYSLKNDLTILMDKDYQKDLAIKNGLKVAKGWVANISNGAYEIPEGISYPCFTKPQTSFLGNKAYMRKCNNEQELDSLLQEVAKQRDCPILVEQFIDIEKEYGLLGFSDGTNVIIPALIDKLMTGSGKHKGVTLLGKVTSIYNYGDLHQKITEFIKSTGFVGLFDIDLYENNGIIYFNELNLRMGAFGYAILCSEINLPKYLVNYLSGQENDFANSTLEKEITCISEKVNLEDFSDGYIDWSTYKKRILMADKQFIKSDKDKNVYRVFYLEILKQKLKRLLKR